MKIRLLSVGKPRDGEVNRLHDEYGSRLVRLGVGYESSHVAEVRQGTRFTDDHVRQREARSLLDRIERDRPTGTLIALDSTGDSFTSPQLAASVERWSLPVATFVVGGPLGLHGDLLERADRRWSLSRLTFPHEFVRVIVAEQLYRAVTILRRIPYHK